MTDPLKIMDKVERRMKQFPVLYTVSSERPLPTPTEWQSLRTAIEAQAEELAQARNDLERMEDAFQRRVVLHAEALARIARLEECIRTLTYSNYRDGRRFIEFPQNSDVTDVTEILNESEPQSHAAVKAEALREYARKIANADKFGHAEDLFREADRIEREAKEDK